MTDENNAFAALESAIERDIAAEEGPEEAAPEPQETRTQEPGPDDAQTEEAERVDEVEEAPDGAEADPEAEDAASLKFKVTVGGEEKEVTGDELVKGFMMEADYRKKTAALGEERRAFDAEKAAIAKERDDALALARYFEAQVAGEDMSPQELLRLSQEDPIQYAQVRAQMDYRQAMRQTAQEAYQQIQQREEAERQQRLHAYISEQNEKIKQAVPELADPVKGKALADEMQRYLQERGFSANDIQTLVDHRVVSMIYDAMQYRKVKSAKPAIDAKIAKAPLKVIRPGVAKSPVDSKAAQLQAQRAQVRKTGSVESLQSYLEQLM